MGRLGLAPNLTPLPLGHQLGQQVEGGRGVLAANGGFHGLDLRPELLGGYGAFGGAVDEGVGGGFADGSLLTAD